MFKIWGVPVFMVRRQYGPKFFVDTVVNEPVLRHLLPTGLIPAAVNDNVAVAA